MTSGPIELGDDAALVLCFDPELDLGVELRGRGPLALVSDGGAAPLRPPGGWAQVLPFARLESARLDPALKALAPRQAVIHALRGLRIRPVLAAIRAGVRRFHVVYAAGASFPVNARGALALALRERGRRGVGSRPGGRRLLLELGWRSELPFPTPAATAATNAALLEWGAARPPAPGPAGERLRVLHYVGSLGAGGAERQLVELASATAAAGHEVAVATAYALSGGAAHHRPTLEARGIRVCPLTPWEGGRSRADAALPAPLRAALRRDHCGAPLILPLLELLGRGPLPDVLHCWLDEANLCGALAGLLAGVPRVVVSVRSLSPARVPHLDAPWYREAYRQLAERAGPRLRFTANSRAGAADYADWLGSPPLAWEIQPNGLDLGRFVRPSPAARAEGRAAWGIGPEEFLVIGVLRASAEKRPLDFVRAVAAARGRVPGLRALHVGDGPLLESARRLADELGLGEALRFLGRRSDAEALLALADAALLTSELEGCPNVSLESQALGVPIVLTDGGGGPETVRAGETGLVFPVGDVQAAAGHLVALAGDPARRAAMGERARAWVEERFALPALLAATLALYRGEGRPGPTGAAVPPRDGAAAPPRGRPGP